MLNIGIAGCNGRMGKMLIEAAREYHGARLTVTSARTEGLEEVHTYLQREGLHQVKLTDKVETLVNACDAVIDFTAADYSMEIAAEVAKQHKIHICGTTGFSEAQEQQLQLYATDMRLVKAANFSVGVNLLIGLTQKVASVLDNQFDIEITEMHHRYKKDAPSGTALALGKAAAQGRHVTLEAVVVHGRKGMTGERKEGTIGFHALRGGDVIGDHTVTFAGQGERLELTHRSSDRRIYADGAMRSALWAKDKLNGCYSMMDVLDLK